jgi:hypothetical protein
MRNRPLLIIAGLIGLIVVGAAGWYLASPLFTNRVVDDPFPLDVPSEAALAQMSQTELQSQIPSADDMARLSPGQQEIVADRFMEVAAEMPDETMDEAMPATDTQPLLLVQGQFKDADSFHQGSGTATIYQLPDGSQVLRFEGFTVTNGPDLHVLLATSSSPSDRSGLGDYLDLGSLSGNTGNQNYDIPVGTDISQYLSVVIYCMPFHVVFATADLG